MIREERKIPVVSAPRRILISTLLNPTEEEPPGLSTFPVSPPDSPTSDDTISNPTSPASDPHDDDDDDDEDAPCES